MDICTHMSAISTRRSWYYRCRLVRYFSSSLIGGGRWFNTLLSVMLSIAVLTNEVCTAWSDAFFVLASNGTTVSVMPSEKCLLHFPRWIPVRGYFLLLAI